MSHPQSEIETAYPFQICEKIAHAGLEIIFRQILGKRLQFAVREKIFSAFGKQQNKAVFIDSANRTGDNVAQFIYNDFQLFCGVVIADC